MGKGQIAAADYTMIPEVILSDRAARVAAVASAVCLDAPAWVRSWPASRARYRPMKRERS